MDIEKLCAECGKTIVVKQRLKQLNFCSRGCGTRYYAKHPTDAMANRGDKRRTGKLFQCGICGEEVYLPEHRIRRHQNEGTSGVFCSQKCVQAARHAKSIVPDKTCLWCGVPFRSYNFYGDGTKQTRYCSPYCSRKATNERLHPSAGRQANKRRLLHNYRARKREVFVEDVPFDYIYERDKGICQICKRKCSTALASLDHILPLSKGGKHEKKNVQLAHRRCNSSKLNTGVGRLRLIG